jgi:hypothetical protein
MVKTRKEADMKIQLAKPARTKARYTQQYKQEALQLWRASGRSAAKVAAELGIRPPLLVGTLGARTQPSRAFSASAVIDRRYRTSSRHASR